MAKEEIENFDGISNEELEKRNNSDKNNESSDEHNKNNENEISPDDEINNLKDKLSRAYAEIENQRRRFDKEKNEAYEYGGFAFAKEALNILDNLERSKNSLENDESLKDKTSLKKIIEHIEIINSDMLMIFKKNNIEPI